MVFRDEEGNIIISQGKTYYPSREEPEPTPSISSTPKTVSSKERLLGTIDEPQEPVISDAIKSASDKPSVETTPDPALVSYLTSGNAPSIFDLGLVDPNIPVGVHQSTWEKVQEGFEKTGDATPMVQTSNITGGTGMPEQLTSAPNWTSRTIDATKSGGKGRIMQPWEKLTEERGIDPSPYLKKYGYTPQDPDYDIIEKDISEKMGVISANIKQVGSNIETSTSYIDQINLDIAMVESQPDQKWTLTGEGFDPELLYSSSDLLDTLKGKRLEYQTNLSEAEGFLGDVPSWEQQRSELKEFQKDMDTYEKLGYTVDILEDESVQVGLPKASTVHDWYVGEDKSGKLLGATSFLESPLAVRSATDILAETAFQTFKEDPSMVGVLKLGSNLMFGGSQLIGKTVTDWATGARDIVPEHTKERLSEFSLDLSKSLKEGGGLEFGGKVLTSPAMIEGVYIPLATMGTGYLVTGLGGKTVTMGSSALSTFGKTTGGKITRTAITGTGLVLGGAGITMLGAGLYEVAQTQPEAIPGILGETAFTFGMAYGGYKTGQQLWKTKHTGSWKYDWDTGKSKWDPYEIPKQKDVKFIQPDVIVGEINDKAIFSGRSATTIGGKPVDVVFKGIAHKSKTDPRFALAKGEGWATEKTTKTLWGKQIGENIISRRFTFESPSVILGQKGQESIYFNVAESNLFAGQPGSYGYGAFSPTRSKGLTWMHEVKDFELIKPKIETGWQLIPDEIGGIKAEGFAILDADIIGMKQYNFLHVGKYASGNIYGNIKGMGRMFAYDIKSGGAHGLSGGSVAEGFSVSGGKGGLLSKLDMGGIVDVIGGKLGTIGDLGASTAEGGSASGTASITMASGVGANILHTPFQSLGSQSMEGSASLDLQPVQAWGGLVSIFTPPETIQERRTRSGRRSGRRSRSLLGTEQTGKVDVDQDIGEVQAWGYKTVQEPVVDLWQKMENELGLGTGLDMGIAQMQYQEQQQDLSTVGGLNLLTIHSPLTFRIFDPHPVPPVPVPPVPVPFFLLDDPKDQRDKRKKKQTRRKQRSLFDTHQMDKGLLSDLASVTRSHGRFGIATHPKLTEEIWGMGEKSMFMHVPTVELMSGKKKKKKTKKWLDITNRRMSDVLM